MPTFSQQVFGQWNLCSESNHHHQYILGNGIVINWWNSKNGTLNVSPLPKDASPAVQEMRDHLVDSLRKKGWTSRTEISDAVALFVPEQKITIDVMPLVRLQIHDHGQTGVQCTFSGGGLENRLVITYYPTNQNVYSPTSERTEIEQSIYGKISLLSSVLGQNDSDSFIRYLKQIFPEHRVISDDADTLEAPFVATENTAVLRTASSEVSHSHRSDTTSSDAFSWKNCWPSSYQLRKAARNGQPCQEDLLNDWSTTVQRQHRNDNDIVNPNKKHLMAQAPTGLGKTIAALVPGMEWLCGDPSQRQIFFLVGRDEQHRNPIYELEALADIFEQRTGTKLRVVDLIGRSKMCHDPRHKKLTERCTSSKESASWRKIPNIANASSVKSHLASTEPNTCPYHTQQGLMASAHVVVCDYWWFFSEQSQTLGILSYLNIVPSNVVLIVDEVHNVPNRVRTEFEVRISESDIEDSPCADVLQSIFDHLGHPNHQKGLSSSELRALLSPVQMKSLHNQRELEEKSEVQEASLVTKVCWNLEQPDGCVVAYRTENLDGQICMAFSRIDIQDVLRRGYEHVHASLSMSGTLAAPSDSDVELRYQLALFGLNDNQAISRCYDSPFSLKNQRWLFSNKAYGTWKERQQYIPTYVQDIEQSVRVTPKVTVVFCNSYAFLQQIEAALSSEIRKCTVVEQQHEQTSLNDLQLQLRNLVAQHGHALLLAVYQGQISEGANFADNLIQSIFCLSLPIEYPDLVHEYLQQHYQTLFHGISQELGHSLQGKVEEYSLYRLSLSLILQSTGRGIRGMSDRCAVVLHDKRYGQWFWRQFLRTAPFNVSSPSKSIERFWKTPSLNSNDEWDSIIQHLYSRSRGQQ